MPFGQIKVDVEKINHLNYYFMNLMHWLHVNLNSDSMTFQRIFGKSLEEFWVIFCSYFADILPKNTTKFDICLFLADNLPLTDFQQFLAKFWQIFENN